MAVKKHRRLTRKERVQIETLLNEKESKSYIAKTLKRARSTISREVNKWVEKKTDKYDADLAHWRVKQDYLNKRNLDKISTYSLLKFFVYRGLLSNWTPEQISGRLKELYPNCLAPYITGFTISELTTKKIWDKYYTVQPRLRTALEKKYKRLIRLKKFSLLNITSTLKQLRNGRLAIF